MMRPRAALLTLLTAAALGMGIALPSTSSATAPAAANSSATAPAAATSSARDASAHGSSAAPAPLRVMPLGNSITWGVGSPSGNSYRGFLWNQLTADGYPLDFVGSVRN
ncbi:hypothetical protein [Streptomyces sp. NPDC047046]|uniref:hypothetical protein n=1 Tax=Streptomyces sp. NPDC047046 TaxID=3155378 RepID=UPI0033CC3F68